MKGNKAFAPPGGQSPGAATTLHNAYPALQREGIVPSLTPKIPRRLAQAGGWCATFILMFVMMHMMPNQAKAQAGVISFVPQPNAANNLRRMAVQWSGFAPGQTVSLCFINVSVSSTDLIYLDRDAMAAQGLGIPGSQTVPALGSLPYTGGGSVITLSMIPGNSFNTSNLPNPCTLFTFNYTGTPDCIAPLDTSIQFSFGMTAYFSGGAIRTIGQPVPSVQQSFSCNSIRGVITTAFGDTPCEDNINGGIPGVDVAGFFRPLSLTPATNPVEVNLDTDRTFDDGRYLLDDMPSGVNVTVRPSKLDNEACGITTFDLNEMQKYILGIPSEVFVYPWQIIAADVNYSGELTAFDISLASRWMQGIPFPPNWVGPIPRSWTFVPTNVYGSFAPPSGGSPFGYPYSEEISFSPLNSNQLNQDYFGIKRGDIDGSCNQCGDPFTGGNEDRSAEAKPLSLTLSDRAVQAGELIVLPISMDVPEPLNVIALKIQADPDLFDIEGIRAGNLPFLDDAFTHPENGGLPAEASAKEGVLRFVWFNPEHTPVSRERFGNMFSVALRAKQSMPSLQGHVAVTDFDGNALWGASSTPYRPELRWVSGQSSVPVFQVGPSPFSTQIGFTFESAQDTDVDLRILSASGAEVYRSHNNVGIGVQQVSIDGSAWPSGVYLYEMWHGSERKVGRLVKQ